MTKFQVPNNIQSPNSSYENDLSFFGHRNFGHYLVIGAWYLVLYNLHPKPGHRILSNHVIRALLK